MAADYSQIEVTTAETDRRRHKYVTGKCWGVVMTASRTIPSTSTLHVTRSMPPQSQARLLNRILSASEQYRMRFRGVLSSVLELR